MVYGSINVWVRRLIPTPFFVDNLKEKSANRMEFRKIKTLMVGFIVGRLYFNKIMISVSLSFLLGCCYGTALVVVDVSKV